MIGLILNLLHLVALVLLVRCLIPSSAVFLNPYTHLLNANVKRLTNFFQSGLPLSLRGVCCFLLLLTLISRAAILASLGANKMLLAGPFVLVTFHATTILDWFLIECIDFAFFYYLILSATTFFRFWHLLKPIPGLVADLFFVSAYPFARFKLRHQCAILLLGGMFLFMCVQTLRPEIEYPLLLIDYMKDLPQEQAQSLQAFFNFETLPHGLWHLLLTLFTFFSVFIHLADILLMLLWAFLIALLFRSRYVHLFIHETLQLICGRLPQLRLGRLNFTPLLLCLLFPLFFSLFSFLILFLIRAILYVV